MGNNPALTQITTLIDTCGTEVLPPLVTCPCFSMQFTKASSGSAFPVPLSAAPEPTKRGPRLMSSQTLLKRWARPGGAVRARSAPPKPAAGTRKRGKGDKDITQAAPPDQGAAPAEEPPLSGKEQTTWTVGSEIPVLAEQPYAAGHLLLDEHAMHR